MKSSGKGSAFFHTLVIMGGSLAGCGGQAQDGSTRRSGDGDGSGSGGSSSGGQLGDGDIAFGTGGIAGVTGGRSGDGDLNISSGGTPSTGGNYMGGAHGLGCPPEQWECTGIPWDCSWEAAELLRDCTCEPSRPVTQADCPAGTKLTCMEGIEYDPQTFEGHTQAFACNCLPEAETCREQCAPMVSAPGDCFEPGMTDGFEGYLCGCEIPILR